MIENATTAEGFAALEANAPGFWKEFSELRACFYSPTSDRISRRGDVGDMMVNAGLSYQQTTEALKVADQGAAGRPWAKSPAKLLDAAQKRWEGMSLREIAAMLCDSPEPHGSPGHNAICEANLGRTLRRFRSRLRKLNSAR
jgi:hypothetical protein